MLDFWPCSSLPKQPGWPDPGFAQAEFKQQRFGRHAASPFIQHFGESRRSIGKTPHDYQETGLSPNHEVGRPPLRERSIQFLVSILAKFERPLRWGLYACPRWMLLAMWPGLESTQTLGACLHIKHQVGICVKQAHQYSPPYRHTTILQGQSGKTGSCCHKTSTSRKCYSQGRKTKQNKTQKCCDSEHLNPAKLTLNLGSTVSI